MAGPQQEQLDMRAIELAKEALTKIDTHEQICSLRYTGIEKANNALFSELRKINSRWLYVGGSIMLIMLTIIGVLLSKVLGL